jgi:hypothetical protein
MKKAVLEEGSWRKISKPKVVSQATPPRQVSEQPVAETEPAPRAMRVTRPQQGIGARPAVRVMKGQKVIPATATIGSKPANLRQTERIDEVKQMQTNTVEKPSAADGHYSNSPAAAIEEVAVVEKGPKARQTRRSEKLRNEPSRRRARDLQSGMELLGLDFLLSIVENTDSGEDLDVTMRKLNFNELIRTEQLQAVDSNVLKVYALNEDGFYDKHIQYESIKELTARTSHSK